MWNTVKTVFRRKIYIMEKIYVRKEAGVLTQPG